MNPSNELKWMLKKREQLRLIRYMLGDGGVTIGYGHYEPYSRMHLIPPSITKEEADAYFEQDVEERAAKWVREYVTVPLEQHQFDALVHVAYNLSPKSFKTIAEAVNEGKDPEEAMMKFIRAGTNLEIGLRNRRKEELNLYRNAVYVK